MAWLVKECNLSSQQSLDYLMQVNPGTCPLPEQIATLRELEENKNFVFKMYFLSKFIPSLLMPLNIVISALFIISFKKRNYTLLFTTLLLTFFSNGLIAELFNRLAEYPWKRLSPSEIPSADAIVVLSQRRHKPPGESKIIEWWDDPDRFMSGLMLFKSKKVGKLIFTGGYSPFYPELPPEGDLYKSEAISFGIPKEKIVTTGIVKNTFEEAEAIKVLFSKERPKKLFLSQVLFTCTVQKNLFEKKSIEVIPYPVDFRSNHRLGKSKFINPTMYIPNAANLTKL